MYCTKDDINNYGSIFFLSALSKLIEKWINFTFTVLQNTNERLQNRQSGFRQKQNSLLCAILFDLVDHKILLKKLSCHKCRSYHRLGLSNRTQTVSINVFHSENERISYGIPRVLL